MDQSMIYDFIKKTFDRNSIIFEIGSHFGLDTDNIYSLTGGAEMHCFEPDTRNYNMLFERNVDTIVKLNKLAISNKVGESEMYLSSGKVNTGNKLLDSNDWSASSSLKLPKRHIDRHSWCLFDKKEIVATVTIDYYCIMNNIDYIDFIWMDVQGAEDLVIDGAKDMIGNIHYIYTEFCNDELYDGQLSFKEICDALPSFSVVFIDGENVLLKNNEFRGSDKRSE